jgi:hypothetical protein
LAKRHGKGGTVPEDPDLRSLLQMRVADTGARKLWKSQVLAARLGHNRTGLMGMEDALTDWRDRSGLTNSFSKIQD